MLFEALFYLVTVAAVLWAGCFITAIIVEWRKPHPDHRPEVRSEFVTRIDYSDGTHEFCELDENARVLAIHKAMRSQDPIIPTYTTVPRP